MDTLPKAVNVRWPPDLLQRIDAARGIVPRSAWIRRAAERELEREQAANGAGNHDRLNAVSPPKEQR